MSGSARLTIAIIGCGIGGPAAALFLARAGHRVIVFERADELEPIGAGILLAPTGQFVLDRLGLLPDAIEKGSRIQRLEGRTASGRKVLDVRYRHLSTGLFGLGIQRGSLFWILRNAMQGLAIEIRTGWKIASLSDRHVQSTLGDREGPFDLIIVADGARSMLRTSVAPDTKPHRYSYGALWASATNWGEFPDNVLRQSYSGTRHMVGVLPSGRLEGQEGRRISIFWSIPMREISRWRERGLDRWKADAARLMPGIEELLSQIVFEQQITIASYFDVRTLTSVNDHCVVIGDAAHASSPQLGQGASLALFDAMILAGCIEQDENVMAALLNYNRLRSKHVKFYQKASKFMTPFFQSGHAYLALPRDLFLGTLCRWPWMQREMVATMSGFKESAFARIPQEDQVTLMAAKVAFAGIVSDPAETTDLVRRR